jgi:alanine dehydrogenase
MKHRLPPLPHGIEEAIPVLERAFQQIETGEALERPRLDMYMPCALDSGYYRWGTSEGTSNGIFAIRMKSDVITWPSRQGARTEEKYCVKPGTWCGLVMLFDCANGEPLGFINDGEISRIRVGSAGDWQNVVDLFRARRHVGPTTREQPPPAKVS